MNTESDRYNEIAAMIHSESSPVGIDAKKTHILIIQMLQDMDERLKQIEAKVDSLYTNQ